MDLHLKDKVALITGASGNVGSVVAVEAAKEGCQVVLCGRDQTRLDKTAQLCKKAGLPQDKIFVVTGDLTKREDVESMVESALGNFGQLDILINCAAIVRDGLFLHSSVEQFDEVLNTNLRGPVLMCKAASQHLIESKGVIINVSSLSGIKPNFAFHSFSVAGAALDQFTKCIALELGPSGVRVNSVNPGVIENSEMWTRPGAPLNHSTREHYEATQNKLKTVHPLGALATPRDVARAVLFLASDNASFVNGILLPIDGGKALTSKPAVHHPVPPCDVA